MPKGGGNAALLPWHTYWAETDQTRHGFPQKRKSHAGCHLEKVRLHAWISSLFWFYWVPHSTVAHLRGWWTLQPASEWSAKVCVPSDFPSPAAFLHFLQHPPVFEIMVLAKFLKIAQLQEMTYREVALFGNVLRRNTVPRVLRRCNRGQNANQQAALFRGTASAYLFI